MGRNRNGIRLDVTSVARVSRSQAYEVPCTCGRSVVTKTQLPSREPSNDSGASSGPGQAAWMAFQRLRTSNACAPPHYTPIHTARTWPECRPAGMSTMEQDFQEHRAVSTIPARPIKLPPLKPKRGVPRLPNGKKGNNTSSSGKDWARTWAQQRAGRTHAWNGNDQAEKCDRMCEDKHIPPVPVTNRKREVFVLNEKDAAALKRAKGIYANTKDKALREERIKSTLRSLHQKTVRVEIANSMREYKKKLERDKQNREELKRVRNKYVKDKKRRDQNSYLSLNAFEAPQVSRKSFGLPDDGEEFNNSAIGDKTEKRLREIWTKTVKRAALIETFLNFKTPNVDQFPEIRVKERRVSVMEKNKEEETQPDSLQKDKLKVHIMMSEIDTLSAVDLDEDDRLSELSDESQYK